MNITHHTAQAHNHKTNSLTRRFWPVLGVIALISHGLDSESLAAVTNPTSLVFYAVQNATNPPSQALSVYNPSTSASTVTAIDSTTWMEVSPSATSVTTSTDLTVSVNTSGLTAGTYIGAIVVIVGTSYAALPVTLIISPPTIQLSATGIAKTATLTWDPVANTAVNGYKVYVGTAPGLYTQVFTVGNVTSYTVSSLLAGTTYYFVVTAYNSAGESLPSTEVNRTIY